MSELTEHVPDLPSFGRYRATAELGAGGMGAVYRAYDDRLRREVAIKTILVARGGDELVERFFHEARAVGALAHPNIIAVYDMDVADGTPYLVLELAARGSLKPRIAAGPVDPSTVRAVGIQIAQALAAAHARGILHRDVKPANILETDPGTFKLADFGIARLPDSTLTMSGMFLGSPAYAAPESLERGAFSPASDVYGLAATLYELCAGEPPFGRGAGLSSIVAAIQQGPRPLGERPNVPPELAATIMRGLDRDPARRPSALDFAHQLSTNATPLPFATAATAMSPSMSFPVAASGPALAAPPRRRRAALIAAAVAGLLLVGVIAATSGDSPHGDARHAPAAPIPAAPAALPAVGDEDVDAPLVEEWDGWDEHDRGPPEEIRRRLKHKKKGKRRD